MQNLFVYGTLCLPEVRDVLMRRAVTARAATLAAHRVARVDGHTYPTLVPADDERADGYVLHDLTPAEHRVLRLFEPPVYDLVAVTVTPVDAANDQKAVTYRHRDAATVAREPWMPAAFVGAARRAFLAEVGEAASALWDDVPFTLRALAGG